MLRGRAMRGMRPQHWRCWGEQAHAWLEYRAGGDGDAGQCESRSACHLQGGVVVAGRQQAEGGLRDGRGASCATNGGGPTRRPSEQRPSAARERQWKQRWNFKRIGGGAGCAAAR